MTSELIESVLGENLDRVTLFVSCGDVIVFGRDATLIQNIFARGEPYEGGVRYSSNMRDIIKGRLLDNHNLVTIVEDVN